jgi:hypothetical protein
MVFSDSYLNMREDALKEAGQIPGKLNPSIGSLPARN